MGGFCCCLSAEEFDEYVYPNNPIYRQCVSLRHLFHSIFGGYTATFQRLESRPNNPAQGVAPLGSTNPSVNINDNSLNLVSRPPPYDTDPRYARVQREGLVSRREKSINLAQEESLALRRNASSSGIEHLAAQKKRNSTENEGEYKVHRSESTKSLSAKAYSSSYAVVASEDEDVCPTCLEEYTPDNPKIITKCCHHFHLGCIYEWMERSDTCPICGNGVLREPMIAFRFT
ncbi:E3 ubiquitin-protein ligase At3g02290 isoform X1 [Zea mays]|uniref:RING-type E3 ubiquitin transferase n=1 Tax=Zea mays TaxID=4577 RepID=A0A1D6N2L7_MAIZE|nr:uncharacterized protein LOC100282797 isoform X1 [Zea mays]XP_008672882.1 uncharacterized protein LOC100282797 isoform X1 [Zea mays]ONM34955.1 RING/U-box superfamily protein [Zea mays]|eukprot:XP_008672881.1 uncharacterized protein LOC100282797 isoform X1 [Zea mays]